jgi:hypothetical protein
MDAGVHERLFDPIAIDRQRGLVGVLLDDREQVREQPSFDRGQLGPFDRGLGVRALDPIDRRAQCDERGPPAVLAVLVSVAVGALPAVRARSPIARAVLGARRVALA